MEDKEYCGWKHILMFILWTFVWFYGIGSCSNATSDFACFMTAVTILAIWVGVSLWIIKQGKIKIK